MLPAIVRERDLVAANSGLWTAAVVSQVVLAPLAGIVVVIFGYTWAFWINAASYLLSALALRRLTVPAAPATTMRTSWYAEPAAGIAAVAGHRLLRALAVGQVLAALSAGATGALLVVLASEHLALRPGDYGLLLGAIGVGAALGPLLSRLTDDPRRPVHVLGPFVLRAVVDAVLATATGLAAAMATLLAYGMATSTGAVTFHSLLQAETPGTGCTGWCPDRRRTTPPAVPVTTTTSQSRRQVPSIPYRTPTRLDPSTVDGRLGACGVVVRYAVDAEGVP